MDSIKKDLIHSFFQRDRWRLHRCLAPGMLCKSPAIRAHSVQNSRVLDLLVRDGHIKALSKKIDAAKGPIIFFDDVGRNQATTFGGFCLQHDSEIFRPIDTTELDPCNAEHLFLLAYRAVARELHALMEATIKVQGAYQKRIALGLDSGDDPSPAGLFAVDQMIKTYQTFLYKGDFDGVYNAKNYGDVVHDVIRIEHQEATVAVCSLFSIDDTFQGDDWLRVALNVLPASPNHSIVVFSYRARDAGSAKSSLHRILVSDGPYQKYLLSKLILNNCENFVVSPAYYDKWAHEKEIAITNYFVQTMFQGNLEAENEHLYLF